MKKALAAAVFCLAAGPAAAAVTVDTVVTAAVSSATARRTDIAVDSHNNVHVAYFSGSTQKVKYVKLKNGTTEWSLLIPDSSAALHGPATSIALDGLTPHVLFYDVTNGALMRARLSGTSWLLDSVAAFVSTYTFSSLAVTSNGGLRAAYYDVPAGALKYATLSGGSWTTSSVYAGVVTDCDLALKSSGDPVIAFTAEIGTNTALMVGSSTSTAFAVSTITFLGSSVTANGTVSVAVDSSDELHLAVYEEIGQDVYYASSTAGVVNFTLVDSSGDAGRESSIALDSSDEPVITYWTPNGGVSVARRVAGVWTRALWDTGAAVGIDPAIALNELGSAFVSYLSADAAALKFATEAFRGLSLSGTVAAAAGGPLTGVSIALTGSVDDASTLDAADGSFSFSDLLEGSYTLTPARDGHAFLPSSRTMPSIRTGVTGISFVGGPVGLALTENLIDPLKGQQATVTFSVLPGRVLIRLRDLRGHVVKTLVDEEKTFGTHTVTWDGRNESGEPVASGIYLVNVDGTGVEGTGKIAVVK